MLFIILRAIISALRSHRALDLENLALRHQLSVLQRNARRPRLKSRDRVLWIALARLWGDWRESLTIVQPETVIRWHKRGFQLYWTWKSRPRWPGRQRVPKEVRDLIRGMSRSKNLPPRAGAHFYRTTPRILSPWISSPSPQQHSKCCSSSLFYRMTGDGSFISM